MIASRRNYVISFTFVLLLIIGSFSQATYLFSSQHTQGSTSCIDDGEYSTFEAYIKYLNAEFSSIKSWPKDVQEKYLDLAVKSSSSEIQFCGKVRVFNRTVEMIKK
ncbi:MAG: hypothetical protein L6Q37_14685 [Bdellovibrionaceae bacterium]|nr:hypothetical protein [Pseudobdellovibrionaceae bacterium]NUM60439.1 hypothetical protein [Pseudobdellovibrionaceae bacterium]